MLKIKLITKLTKNEVIVQPILEESKQAVFYPVVKTFLLDNPKFGKLYETQLLYDGTQKILLVGAGKKDKLNFEKAQNIAGTMAKSLMNQVNSLSINSLKDLSTENLTEEQLLEAFGLGLELAIQDPAVIYKSEKEPIKLKEVQIITDLPDKLLAKSKILADSINLARKLGDMPSNEMTPTYFLNQAKRIAKEQKLKITVIDEKQAKKLGMGGFVGVAQGSEEPSYVITLEYTGNLKSKDKYGLVGKGITFDSGGISIKPAASMHEMKYDMCGAAAVLASVQALSKLKTKTNVIGVMCVTENLPGGRAQRPGDIVKTLSGKTAEVLNTDAEGRLVLVDGLTLAQQKGATKLIDLATLTGAVIVALGDYVIGGFSNNDKFAQDVITAGAKVGEKIWQLPMYEEYDEMIKSDMADISNIGHGGSMPGAAGSITAAKFLEAVIEKDRPWIHLDIAGTAWDLKPRPFRIPGATGVGIKTLVELIAGV